MFCPKAWKSPVLLAAFICRLLCPRDWENPASTGCFYLKPSLSRGFDEPCFNWLLLFKAFFFQIWNSFLPSLGKKKVSDKSSQLKQDSSKHRDKEGFKQKQAIETGFFQASGQIGLQIKITKSSFHSRRLDTQNKKLIMLDLVYSVNLTEPRI